MCTGYPIITAPINQDLASQKLLFLHIFILIPSLTEYIYIQQILIYLFASWYKDEVSREGKKKGKEKDILNAFKGTGKLS